MHLDTHSSSFEDWRWTYGFPFPPFNLLIHTRCYTLQAELPKIKVSFLVEKNKLIDVLLIFIVLYCGRNEFEFLCLRGKGCKGICYVPRGPQMLLLLPPCSGNLLWCRLWSQRDKKKHEFPASCRGQKLLWTKWKKNKLKQHFGRNFGRASIINRHACIMHKGLFFVYSGIRLFYWTISISYYFLYISNMYT